MLGNTNVSINLDKKISSNDNPEQLNSNYYNLIFRYDKEDIRIF